MAEREVRVRQRVGGGLVALLLVTSTVMACLPTFSGPPAELDITERTVMLAKQNARDGYGDIAVDLLHIVRSKAERHRDLHGLRRVAEGAVRVGGVLSGHAQWKYALVCLDMATDISSRLAAPRPS